jgi:hypothetical protein
MARSPKAIVKTTKPVTATPKVTTKRDMPLKSILKEAGGGERSNKTVTETTLLKGDNNVDDAEEYYYKVFNDLVRDLPKVDENSTNPDIKYTVSEFQDDIVSIIADINDSCKYLVIPDQDMLLKIVGEKITDSKLRNEFIYGKEGGMNNSKLSCHEKIKQYSFNVRKNHWDDIINKYSKIEM